MRITTLIENLSYKPDLIGEHGLSILFEINDKKILLDCGQSHAFIRNAYQLSVDPASVDFLILSHGHYDHCGGLSAFLKINKKAIIFLKRKAADEKYHGGRYIGMNPNVSLPENRTVYIEQPTEITDNFWIIPDTEIYAENDVHNHNLKVRSTRVLVPDSFDDELFITYIADNKLNVFSSCSHRGITNMVQTAINRFRVPAGVILGGFHIQSEPAQSARFIAEYFNKINPDRVGVCHCIGVENYTVFKKYFAGDSFYNYTGYRLNLP